MFEATVPLAEPGLALSLFGTRDQNLRAVREALGVTISHRDSEIRIQGEEAAVAKATTAFEQLKGLAQRGTSVGLEDVKQVLASVTGNGSLAPFESIDVVSASRTIKPRSAGQAR